MRDEHPVYRREIENFRVWPHYWMLSRADDVDHTLSDWQTFSSARGTLVDTDITLIPPNMFNMDPPRHDELPRDPLRNLTPSRISALEPHVRAYTEQLVDGFASTGAFDAQRDFGHLVPTITMCVLMDLPAADHERFLKWNLDTLGGADFTSEAALAAYGEMAVYWEGIVADGRGGDGTDLISQIVNTQLPGEDLSDAEIAGFCSLLHDAAQNTTMNMIAHGVLTLAHEPDARRRLGAEPGLWPKAVEELLRYVSPVQGPRARRPAPLSSTVSPSPRAIRSLSSTAPPTTTTASTPTPNASISTARAPRRTGRSATVFTTASATRSPGSRSRPRCGSSSSASATGTSTTGTSSSTNSCPPVGHGARRCRSRRVGLNGQMTSSPPASRVSKYSRSTLSTSSTRSPHSLAWKTKA